MLPAHSTPRIVSKEREKIDNYCDLKYEIKQIWNCRLLLVIPIVTGALGTVSRRFEMLPRHFGTPQCMKLVQLFLTLLG